MSASPASLGLAARLRAGDNLLGLVVKIPSAAVLEMAGHIGFDLAVIDCEHGSAETEALEHHVRAADSAGLPTLVRVGSRERWEVLRVLDAGATGIVVPHVNDLPSAREAVAAAHYPPRGRRGLATSTRAGRHGLVGVRDHLRRAAEETVVVVQVEDVGALPHVAAIASEANLDVVFLGPTDLSLSLGHPGDLEHPVVSEAIDQVATTVLGTAGAALCVLVSDEDEARLWRARGAQIVLFAAAPLISGRLRAVAEEVKGGTQIWVEVDR